MNLDTRKSPENLDGYKLDTKKLLSELSENIKKDFGISKETAEKLTKLKTSNGLEGLRSEILESNISKDQKEILNKFDNEKIEKLFFTLSGAKEVISKATHKQIEVLKEEIPFIPNTSWIEDRLPSSIIHRIINPKNIGDNILGAAIGTVNSLQKTVEALYNIGAGIIKAPYHIYMIVSGKASYENIKKV